MKKRTPQPFTKGALSCLACLACLTRDTAGKIGLAVFRALATGRAWLPLSPRAANELALAAFRILKAPKGTRAPFPFADFLSIMPRPIPERIGLAVFRALRAGKTPELKDAAENALALAACARLRLDPCEEWAAFVLFVRNVESAGDVGAQRMAAVPLPRALRLDRFAPPPSNAPRTPRASKGKTPPPAQVFCMVPDWQARAIAKDKKARLALAAAQKAVDAAGAAEICVALENEMEAEAAAAAAARGVCRKRPLAPSPSAPAAPRSKSKKDAPRAASASTARASKGTPRKPAPAVPRSKSKTGRGRK